MMGRGDRLVMSILAVMFLDFICGTVLFALIFSTLLFEPERAEAVQDKGFITLKTTEYKALEFETSVKDRPMLESVQQVWQARTTGISEFNFDGVHYVIENLPKEYVDYSSWYVRMP